MGPCGYLDVTSNFSDCFQHRNNEHIVKHNTSYKNLISIEIISENRFKIRQQLEKWLGLAQGAGR